MVVVADTTPLNYLILIGQVELLSALYQSILIPTAVHRELLHAKAPHSVRLWVSALPTWCQTHSPKSESVSGLEYLGNGERQAIQLAIERGVETVLMDEREGRREAEDRNLKVVGTLTVLELAGRRGLVDFRAELRKLEQTTFRLSAEVRGEFLLRNP